MDIIEVLQIAAFSILLGYMLAFMPEIRKEAFGAGSLESWHHRRASDDSVRAGTVLAILVLIVSLIFVRDVIVGSTPFGTEAIGSVLEKREYTAEYYVLAFPDQSASLNYRVAAEIHATMRRDGMESERVYELNRFIWPQNGSIYFIHAAGSGYSLELERAVAVTDDDGRKWHIQLTHEKVQ